MYALPVSHSDSNVLPPSIDESHRASRAASAVLALYAIAGGIITLVGWKFGVQRLTDWNDDGVSMFANTAVGVVLLAGALLALPCEKCTRRIQWVTRVLASLAGLIGALTLMEHLFGFNFGIDTLIANQPWGQKASAAPMRMGFPASTSFLVLGSGMLLATDGSQARKIASMFGLGVVAITSLSLIGYWYNADQLYLIPRYTGIAWQTSTMLAALAIGLVAAMPEHGLVAILRRDDAGGLLARRLMVPIVGLPLLLGWLADPRPGCGPV